MAVLSTYLDGGGSVAGSSSSVFTVAGYLATDEQWGRWETDWQAALDRFQVPAANMKQFAQFSAPFEAWKEDDTRRADFLESLANIIHQHDLEGFAFP